MKLSEELYEMAKTYAHNIKGSYLKLSSLEAEQLKERIQELEAQIEKMRNCGNCQYKKGVWNSVAGAYFDHDICMECDEYDKWELME